MKTSVLLKTIFFVATVALFSAHSSFACAPAAKIGLIERLKSELDPNVASNLPDFQVDFDHQGIKILKPYLGEKSKDWYSISIEFSSKDVDPIYMEIARQLGQDTVLGGGSDLIEMALLKDAKLASPGEINVVMDRNLIGNPERLTEMWKDIYISAPAFKGRPAIIEQRTNINGESGINIITMIENVEAGKHLIHDYFPLSVPFKHGHALVVSKEGKARLYFRTTEDFKNYISKTLTLPEEKTFPKDWHVQKKNRTFLPHTMKYHLNVFARAKEAGWRYSATSAALLKSWAAELNKNPAELKNMKERFLAGAKAQQVSEEVALEVWREFDLR